MTEHGATYWSTPAERVLSDLDATPSGLSSGEAAARLARWRHDELRPAHVTRPLAILAAQFQSPLVLLLVGASLVSLLLREWTDAAVVMAIVAASAGVGFWRELDASQALEKLSARLTLFARALRDGEARPVPVRELVPGDVVLLSAGSLVPADAIVLEATDFFVNQAVLTGETFPVEKHPGVVAPRSSLGERTNVVFLGTNVRSGFARCLVVATGRGTEYGAIAHRLALRPPETEFERALRKFGQLLTTSMLVLVLAVFAVNVFAARPAVEALLFAVALAVGLVPELLPAILTVNLARGARAMAARGVLVRRLNAIENLGSMDVLCTDKTGTLTEGTVALEGAFDAEGRPSEEVRRDACLNATFQTGLANPLDEALAAQPLDRAGVEKVDEIPYDFVRKRLTVVVRDRGRVRLVAKGALEKVLEVCTTTRDGAALDATRRAAIEERAATWARVGKRVIAIATREDAEPLPAYHREGEGDLVFGGFVVFSDPPKEGVGGALADLARLGVAVKIITGDDPRVAKHLAEQVGLPNSRVVTGEQLDELHEEALWRTAEATGIFARVDPNQKERIILALRKTGHVVGYLGDGVNDAPALHAADASLSVDKAVDVAREAADFVLLERDLDVIKDGVVLGRTTFANTLKYVLTTTSANFGNMLSMALASLFMPFLPLLAGQILLNNFLSDIPALALATDRVDEELVARPRRWDMRFLRRFMIQFGALSSVFDLLTFAVLLVGFRAGVELFRTGWFVESLLTELAVALVVRTRRPFWRSPPGRSLVLASVAVAAIDFALPYVPIAELELVPVPPAIMATLVAITALYVASTEALKRSFYRSEP